jgi:hypothetical protein
MDRETSTADLAGYRIERSSARLGHKHERAQTERRVAQEGCLRRGRETGNRSLVRRAWSVGQSGCFVFRRPTCFPTVCSPSACLGRLSRHAGNCPHDTRIGRQYVAISTLGRRRPAAPGAYLANLGESTDVRDYYVLAAWDRVLCPVRSCFVGRRSILRLRLWGIGPRRQGTEAMGGRRETPFADVNDQECKSARTNLIPL